METRRLVLGSLLLGAALSLTGCLRGVEVEVSGAPSAPTFTLGRTSWFSGPARPTSLSVYDVDDRLHPVWEVEADPKEHLTGSIQYGRTPPGAIARIAAHPLQEGSIYEVTVEGGGYLGAAFFKSVDGRLTAVQGGGDQPLAEIRNR